MSNYWLTLNLCFGLPLLAVGMLAPRLAGTTQRADPGRQSRLGWLMAAIAGGTLLAWGIGALSGRVGHWSAPALAPFSFLPVLLFARLNPQAARGALWSNTPAGRVIAIALAAAILGWIAGLRGGLVFNRVSASFSFFEGTLLQAVWTLADEFVFRGLLPTQAIARLRNVPAGLLLASLVAVVAHWPAPELVRAGMPAWVTLFLLALVRMWVAWRVQHFAASALLTTAYQAMDVVGV